MKMKNLFAAAAGFAVVGAGVGAALVYLKKHQTLSTEEEETSDMDTEKECECVQEERTYTTLSDAAETDNHTSEEDNTDDNSEA